MNQYVDMLRLFAELFGGLPNWTDFYEIPYPIFLKLLKDKIEVEQKRLKNIERQQADLDKKLHYGKRR